ncbi:MAG: serine/threonine protein kinase, partial [Myxococcota bacterium]|nr:serine/threonine protein kinase [Myxococcota bacterium]
MAGSAQRPYDSQGPHDSQGPYDSQGPHDSQGAPLTEGGAPKLVAFGKYLLLERIATGGMAEVWLGKTVQPAGAGAPGEQVSDLLAIKRLLSKFSDDEEFLHMFVDEARIAGQLDHPGIAQISELGKVGSSLYIAMEFVWGRDLLGIMRRLRELGREVDATTAAYVAARMCESLHFAHTAIGRDGAPLNVVHRDVSPQNVLVSFDGKVKLIDFGIAKAASRSTKTQAGTLKGKVGYMSPEQVQGANIDHRSDQFAVGTVLYEMITGRPLFSRANNYEAMELVREANVPPLTSAAPSCPPRLASIVMKALSKRPEDRFASAHEMQKALSIYLADSDPGYERFTLVTWLRAIFKDEMTEEKARLDALDLIGRATPEPVAKKHTNSSTRLEIGAVDLFDDDEEAETQVFDSSPFSKLEIEVRPVGPYEVFFHRDEALGSRESSPVPKSASAVRPLAGSYRSARSPATESWRAPRGDIGDMGPYRR